MSKSRRKKLKWIKRGRIIKNSIRLNLAIMNLWDVVIESFKL